MPRAISSHSSLGMEDGQAICFTRDIIVNVEGFQVGFEGFVFATQVEGMC